MKRNSIGQAFSGLLVALFVLLGGSIGSVALGAEEGKEGKWGGVDESVVERYAREHGREAREPYINTDQGDLLLFVFLLGGALGGFLAGYSWKNLMDRKTDSSHACGKSPLSKQAGK